MSETSARYALRGTKIVRVPLAEGTGVLAIVDVATYEEVRSSSAPKAGDVERGLAAAEIAEPGGHVLRGSKPATWPDR
jgi:hypothetical protein